MTLIDFSFKDNLNADDSGTTVISADSVSRTMLTLELKSTLNPVHETFKSDLNTNLLHSNQLGIAEFCPTVIGDSNETLTGLVCIDIDLNENLEVDMDALFNAITNSPNCFYCFKTPNGDLKSAFMTDLSNSVIDCIESIQYRYSFCYWYVRECLAENESIPQFIGNARASKLHHYYPITSDPNSYWNLDAELIFVNQLSLNAIENVDFSTSRFVTKGLETYLDIPDKPIDFINQPLVIEMLNAIPKNLTYSKRQPVNSIVVETLGLYGIELLIEHWNSLSKQELKRQIENQLEYMQFVEFKYFVKATQLSESKFVKGYSKKIQYGKDEARFTFPLMLSPSNAKNELTSIFNDFFEKKLNTYVNISCGAGKTAQVLDFIANKTDKNTKILYLVKDHTLSKQIEDSLNQLINPKTDSSTGFEDYKERNKKTVVRILGPSQPIQIKSIDANGHECVNVTTMCIEHTKRKNQVDKYEFCTQSCPLKGDCRYTQQFNSLANIKIMTHHELWNEPSKWAFGSDFILDEEQIEFPDGFASQFGTTTRIEKAKWKADFIVIDEDVLTILKPEEQTEDINSNSIVFDIDVTENLTHKNEKKNKTEYKSIRSIIKSMKNGKTLVDAVLENHQEILDDNKKNKPINSKNGEIEKNENYSEILNLCFEFYCTKNQDFLKGIFLIEKSNNIEKDELVLNRLNQVTDRYKNIPTIILDATADESIVNTVFPNYNFHKILVEQKNDVKIIQLEDKMFVKSDFIIDENEKADAAKARLIFESVVAGIKNLIKDKKSPSLITYKKVKGYYVPFVEMLATRTGIETYGYFGNLRGQNTFENSDCLIVLGRHSIDGDSRRKFASAVFNVPENQIIDNSGINYKPVRMVNGEKVGLANYSFLDNRLNAVDNQISIAETIQAIGRGRPIYGKEKVIYYLSNFALGEHVAITDFIKYEDIFERILVPHNIINYFKKIGFITAKSREMSIELESASYEFKEDKSPYNFVRRNFEQLISEFKAAGFKPYKTSKRNLQADLLIFDLEKYNNLGKKVFEID